MEIDIILVHTGSLFPEYINDCITQLKKYNFNIHLIIDRINSSRIIHEDINIAIAEDYMSHEYKSYKLNHHDVNFRHGFWFNTSTRFILISNYVSEKNIYNFFHIENDVLMYSDLLDVHNKLTNIDKEMHLVIDSETRCIPSIIFFKSPSIANKLCNYIIANNTRNDMVNLYCFFNENKEIVGNLPILPNNVDVNLVNMGGTIASGLINYSNLFTELESIFDGACIGQYLGGVDPRNNPSDTIGFINETTIFDVSIFKYEFINGEPFMILSNDTKVKINNLHIHSKKLHKFINI